jgi:hypothetical protein
MGYISLTLAGRAGGDGAMRKTVTHYKATDAWTRTACSREVVSQYTADPHLVTCKVCLFKSAETAQEDAPRLVEDALRGWPAGVA